jgi:hypothetical protein
MARLARAIQGRISWFPKSLAQCAKFMGKFPIRLVAKANILLWIGALILVLTDPYRPDVPWQAFTFIPVCVIAMIGAVTFLTRRSDWALGWDVFLLIATLFTIPFYVLLFTGPS